MKDNMKVLLAVVVLVSAMLAVVAVWQYTGMVGTQSRPWWEKKIGDNPTDDYYCFITDATPNREIPPLHTGPGETVRYPVKFEVEFVTDAPILGGDVRIETQSDAFTGYYGGMGGGHAEVNSLGGNRYKATLSIRDAYDVAYADDFTDRDTYFWGVKITAGDGTMIWEGSVMGGKPIERCFSFPGKGRETFYNPPEIEPGGFEADAGGPYWANVGETVTLHSSIPTKHQYRSQVRWDINNDGTWDFYGREPTVSFPQPGTYEVCLEACNAYFFSKTDTTTITVRETPSPPSGNEELIISHTDRSWGGESASSYNTGAGNFHIEFAHVDESGEITESIFATGTINNSTIPFYPDGEFPAKNATDFYTDVALSEPYLIEEGQRFALQFRESFRPSPYDEPYQTFTAPCTFYLTRISLPIIHHPLVYDYYPYTTYLLTNRGYDGGRGRDIRRTEYDMAFEVYGVPKAPAARRSLDTNIDGQGTISVSPQSSDNSYIYGTDVTLTAIPDTANDWIFSYWTGDVSSAASSVYLSSVSSNPITVTMDANKTVTAHFSPVDLDKYALDTNSNPSYGGEVSTSPSGGQYSPGTSVTLTASAKPGYRFMGWSGDVSGDSPTKTVTVNSDMTVTANFESTGGGGIPVPVWAVVAAIASAAAVGAVIYYVCGRE